MKGAVGCEFVWQIIYSAGSSCNCLRNTWTGNALMIDGWQAYLGRKWLTLMRPSRFSFQKVFWTAHRNRKAQMQLCWSDVWVASDGIHLFKRMFYLHLKLPCLYSVHLLLLLICFYYLTDVLRDVDVWVYLYKSPFHNFRASRSGDRRILCCLRTSWDGFWSSGVVKGSVGLFVSLHW